MLKKAALVLMALSIAAAADAQVPTQAKRVTDLPSAASANNPDILYLVQGGASKQCTVGQVRNGLLATADGLIFRTVSPPAGTPPVADSSTDTLTITCTGITCTGNASTDTLDLTVPDALIFRTVSPPSGTAPVADGPSDTLTVTCSGITCTGNATTDNLDLAVADASGAAKGLVQLTNHLGGSATAPTVVAVATNAVPTAGIQDHAVTAAKFRQSAAVSVVANPTGSTADVADLSCGADNKFVGRHSGALDCAALTYPDMSAALGYNPDAKPVTACAVSGALCEEWSASGGTAADLGGWSWQNQIGATETVERGSSRITGTASGCQMHVRWQTLGTTGVDFSLTEKVANNSQGGGGPIALISGTEASPTALELVRWDNGSVAHERYTSYAFGGASTRASLSVTGGGESQSRAGLALYIRVIYTASSKTFATYYSVDGETWRAIGSAVMGSHPTSVGYMKSDCVAESAAYSMRTWWWRYLVGSGNTTLWDPVGQ